MIQTCSEEQVELVSSKVAGTKPLAIAGTPELTILDTSRHLENHIPKDENQDPAKNPKLWCQGSFALLQCVFLPQKKAIWRYSSAKVRALFSILVFSILQLCGSWQASV